MWKKRALCLGLTAGGFLYSFPSFAGSQYETRVSSCYEFPEVKESLIINRNGDQTSLKSNESYRMTYAYRQKEVVRLVLQNNEGKGEVSQFDRVDNQSADFHGDSVSSVKKLAENFVASRQAWACKK